MKRFSIVLVLAMVSFFLIIAGGNSVYASSCNTDEYRHKKSGHGPFSKHFGEIDANGDDSVSFEEFKTLFPSTNQNGFNTLDTDKNGTLSHDEWHQFKEMHKGMGGKKHHGQKYHKKKLSNPSKFNAHFPNMDGNKDGRVSLEEFKAHFPGASDHESVFTAIDLDGKGDLDHDEWHEFKAAHGMKHVD